VKARWKHVRTPRKPNANSQKMQKHTFMVLAYVHPTRLRSRRKTQTAVRRTDTDWLSLSYTECVGNVTLTNRYPGFQSLPSFPSELSLFCQNRSWSRDFELISLTTRPECCTGHLLILLSKHASRVANACVMSRAMFTSQSISTRSPPCRVRISGGRRLAKREIKVWINVRFSRLQMESGS
jgi:hypothetical protein